MIGQKVSYYLSIFKVYNPLRSTLICSVNEPVGGNKRDSSYNGRINWWPSIWRAQFSSRAILIKLIAPAYEVIFPVMSFPPTFVIFIMKTTPPSPLPSSGTPSYVTSYVLLSPLAILASIIDICDLTSHPRSIPMHPRRSQRRDTGEEVPVQLSFIFIPPGQIP